MPVPGMQKGTNGGGKGVATNKGSSMVPSKTTGSICLINPQHIAFKRNKESYAAEQTKSTEIRSYSNNSVFVKALIRIKTCITSKNGLPVYHKNP